MNTFLILVIGLLTTFLGGMAIGFMMGIAKGVTLGAGFRTGRPVSPMPWILCFIGSGVLLLTAVGSSIYSIYFLANSVQTNATVTQVIKRRDDDGHVSRTPVYTYTNASGKQFTDRSSASDGREFEIGDAIPIRYLKKSPQQSRVDYFSYHWFLPIFTAVFSIALGALGFGLRWWRGREQQWANQTLKATASRTVS